MKNYIISPDFIGHDHNVNAKVELNGEELLVRFVARGAESMLVQATSDTLEDILDALSTHCDVVHFHVVEGEIAIDPADIGAW